MNNPEIIMHGREWVMQEREPTCPECGSRRLDWTIFNHYEGKTNVYSVRFSCKICSCVFDYSRKETEAVEEMEK